jgi:hypothetical protein
MTSIATLFLGGAQGMAPHVCAYLDPGSGSMLFQILIAGLLSLLYCGKSWISHLRGVLSGRQSVG